MKGDNNNITDNDGLGWGLLGFCIPIVGLTLFLVWKDERPKIAKAAGVGVLIFVTIGVIFYILMFVVMGIDAAAMYQSMGKFLCILLGCHAKADHSFLYRGKRFLTYVRRTGELIGILAGILTVICWGHGSVWLMLFLMVPMVADGLLQLLTPCESGNYRRLVTGILLRIVLVFFFIRFHRTCVRIATEVLELPTGNSEEAKCVMIRSV